MNQKKLIRFISYDSDQNYIYSRQSEEGDGEDTEARSDGLAYPRLRNFVSIADCGDSHLKTESGSSLYIRQHYQTKIADIRLAAL